MHFMTATQPTLAEALLATGVGYERSTHGKRDQQCWLEPGVILRITYPDAAAPDDIDQKEITLGPDRETAANVYSHPRWPGRLQY